MAEGKYPSELSARVTKPSNASVTPRQADSTTASRGLDEASRMSATRRKQPASATLDPPNLCTIQLSILHARPFSLGVLVAPKLDELMNCGANRRNCNRASGRLASNSVRGANVGRAARPYPRRPGAYRRGCGQIGAGPCAGFETAARPGGPAGRV